MPRTNTKNVDWDAEKHPRGWYAEYFEAPPVTDDGTYTIGDEIRSNRGPGKKTHTALAWVCKKKLNDYPDLHAIVEDSDSKNGQLNRVDKYWAEEFCIIRDGKKTPVGLRPAFITLYLSSHSDRQFKRRSYVPVGHYLAKEFAQNTAFGRLRARIEARLERCLSPQSGESVFEKIPYEGADAGKTGAQYGWHVRELPARLTSMSVFELADAVHTVDVLWPTPEEVEHVDMERSSMGLEYDPTNGRLYRKRGPKYNIGKNASKNRPAQLDTWLMAVLTAANGSMPLSQITEVMLVDHQYLAPDHQIGHLEILENDEGSIRADVETGASGIYGQTFAPINMDMSSSVFDAAYDGYNYNDDAYTRQTLSTIIRGKIGSAGLDAIGGEAFLENSPTNALRDFTIALLCRLEPTRSREEIVDQLDRTLQESEGSNR